MCSELRNHCVDLSAVQDTNFICKKDNEVIKLDYVVVSAFGYRDYGNGRSWKNYEGSPNNKLSAYFFQRAETSFESGDSRGLPLAFSGSLRLVEVFSSN